MSLILKVNLIERKANLPYYTMDDDDVTERLYYSGSDEEMSTTSKVELSKEPIEFDNSKVSNDGSADETDLDKPASADNIRANDTHLPGTANNDSGDDSDNFSARPANKSIVKRSRIISDDESGKEDEPHLSLHYSGSENEEGGKTTEETKTVNERPKIWDSDSKSSEKESDDNTQKTSKKIKKKKLVKRKDIERKHKTAAATSENSSSDDEEEAKATMSKLKALCSDESSDSTNSDGNGNEVIAEQSTQPREKPAQRVRIQIGLLFEIGSPQH